ncbi:hypothetical protein PGTUg99_032029 [Puccinia graminis f. sp. tritici]|uniref:Uncharacterized protein n=1 Tax=Puccinia graminis f. sp. tritici TaxID=56615 RepID=A0A5B0SP84_PUCGR|nr:hypothetical protein PGTUg99_032029 [Puccinia graminis f. sp. tritici]
MINLPSGYYVSNQYPDPSNTDGYLNPNGISGESTQFSSGQTTQISDGQTTHFLGVPTTQLFDDPNTDSQTNVYQFTGISQTNQFQFSDGQTNEHQLSISQPNQYWFSGNQNNPDQPSDLQTNPDQPSDLQTNRFQSSGLQTNRYQLLDSENFCGDQNNFNGCLPSFGSIDPTNPLYNRPGETASQHNDPSTQTLSDGSSNPVPITSSTAGKRITISTSAPPKRKKTKRAPVPPRNSTSISTTATEQNAASALMGDTSRADSTEVSSNNINTSTSAITAATNLTRAQAINRFLSDVNIHGDNIQQPEERVDYTSKTAEELRGIAVDKSKKRMTNADVDFFLEFHLTQQRDLALQAIERQVSVDMIEKLLKQALRAATIWNNFQRSPEARAIFRESGNGVRDKEAMKKLSAIWDAMSLEEKKAFATDPTAIPDKDAESMSGQTGVAGTIATSNERNTQATTESVPSPSPPVVAGLRVSSKSLKAANIRVDNWMADWQAKAYQTTYLHTTSNSLELPQVQSTLSNRLSTPMDCKATRIGFTLFYLDSESTTSQHLRTRKPRPPLQS